MRKPEDKISSDPDKLLKKNKDLIHSDNQKVVSHVQRNKDDWIINTLLIEDINVPFKFNRKTAYRDLKGARVNITYYPDTEEVAGINMEIMKIVRIRKS